jgi:hypothetical protein
VCHHYLLPPTPTEYIYIYIYINIYNLAFMESTATDYIEIVGTGEDD